MKPLSTSNFGLLIAFLLPGFTALWGASYFSETLRFWLAGAQAGGLTVGGFLYVTLASVAAGITASTVRWAVIDKIHHWAGLREPLWNFSRLQENVSAYNVLREMHLRYYYFYSNMQISLAFVYLARRTSLGFFSAPLGWADLGFVLLAVILFAGSRDTLRKYYERVSQLLGSEKREKRGARSTAWDQGGMFLFSANSRKKSSVPFTRLRRPSLAGRTRQHEPVAKPSRAR